jgi:cellulose synthase/poly-beta-1,6-N-acetylglucosamine synthase-like glycosyltransferase
MQRILREFVGEVRRWTSKYERGRLEGLKRAPRLVSILINNYNYAQFLREAIESALCQCDSAVEIIVVDEGSAGRSREIISPYGSRVTAIYKENCGQTSAFNAGSLPVAAISSVFLIQTTISIPKR